jgi:hypothetical protein
MKRTFLYLLAGLVVAMLVVCVALLRPARPVSSGQLALPDGSVVRIIAVTYGTNHVAGSVLARLVDKWPPRVQAVAKRLFGVRASALGKMATPESRLVVWVDRTTNSTMPTGVFSGSHVALADGTAFVSGSRVSIGGWWSTPMGLSFGAVPRRDRQLSLQFFHYGTGGPVTNSGSLSFENPLFGTHPQWTPEALPATKRAGDAEVTLDKLSTGHGNHTRHQGLPGGRKVIEFGDNTSEGRNTTVCVLHLRSLTDSNEVWKVAGVQLNDATGNRLGNESMSWGGEEEDYLTFAPNLWAGESAWRLDFEIKRTRNFKPEELLTFRNVPLGVVDGLGGVGVTNRVAWTSNTLGVSMTLDRMVRRPPNTNNTWSSDELSQVVFTHAPLATNTHLDLLRMVMDTGETNLPGSWSASRLERTYSFQMIPLRARTADFTFAVHTSRWAQFTVKPEVRTARLEYPSQPKGK